jgi:hypothetical protein
MDNKVATYAGEFIHSAYITMPTKTDGDIAIFFFIDAFTTTALPAHLSKSFDEQSICIAIQKALEALPYSDSDVLPTFIMSYGLDYWKSLETDFAPYANLKYDVEEANRITKPAIDEILQGLGK